MLPPSQKAGAVARAVVVVFVSRGGGKSPSPLVGIEPVARDVTGHWAGLPAASQGRQVYWQVHKVLAAPSRPRHAAIHSDGRAEHRRAPRKFQGDSSRSARGTSRPSRLADGVLGRCFAS